MLAGFAKRIITPCPGRIMAGYEGLRKSTGVLDELHVRCIYLEQKEAVLLLSYDLLYVDGVMVKRLVDQLHKVTTVKQDHIIVSAIHTHSGPGQLLEKSGYNKRLSYIDGEYDEDLIDTLVMHSVEVAKQSISKKAEATLSFAQRPVHDVGSNRNNKDALIDDMLTVLEVNQLNGSRAILFSYACHPTILHEENTKYSCDLLGPTYEVLEKEVDVAMFVNGPCGDVSTRFSKRANTVEEVDRLGKLLAHHVQEVRRVMVPMTHQLQVEAFSFLCPARKYVEDAVLNQQYAEDQLSNQQQNFLLLYKQMRKYCEHQVFDLPIRIMKLGDLYYVYVPVELFSKLALQAKKVLNNHKLVFVSYAMDYMSYLPDATAYHEEPIGFEAVISPFEEGCGEALIEEIVHHIQRTK